MKKDSGSDEPTTVTVTTPEQPPVVVEQPAPATRKWVNGGGMIFRDYWRVAVDGISGISRGYAAW